MHGFSKNVSVCIQTLPIRDQVGKSTCSWRGFVSAVSSEQQGVCL